MSIKTQLIPKLTPPYSGTYPLTLSFGQTVAAEALRMQYAQWNLKGHHGLDFALPKGTPVLAVCDGNVEAAGRRDSFGTSIVLTHPWGKTLYAHLDTTKVRNDACVKRGDRIAFSGTSGFSTGPHLHFGILPTEADSNNGYGGYIDPLPFFRDMTHITNPPKNRHITVTLECFIHKKGSYLMLKRNTAKAVMPGVIMAPGGKREFHEALFDAARREIFEETGLTIQNIHVRAIGNAYLMDLQEEFFFHFVFAEYKKGYAKKHTDDGQFLWMTPKDMLKDKSLLSEIAVIAPYIFTDFKTPISFSAVYEKGNTIRQCHIEKR